MAPREEAATPRVAVLPSGGNSVTAVKLTHPATGTPAAFLISKEDSTVAELNVFRPAFAGWLAGEAAVGDGGLWMATPVDPLLLLIPALERARAATAARPEGVFVDLGNALLDDPTCPALHSLLPLVIDNGQLDCVCEKKELNGQTYYRLQDARVAAWLDLKVGVTKEAIKRSSARSMSCLEGTDLESYAVGLLSEYLPPAMAAALVARRGVVVAKERQGEEPSGGMKWVEMAQREVAAAEEGKENEANKRPRLDREEMAKKRAKERAKAVKEEAKAAQVKRETRGMASIASFFTKK